MLRRKGRSLVFFGVFALISGCGNYGNEVTSTSGKSLSIGDVAPSVGGNVVTLPVTIEGIDIVKADGDTTGESGHFHVFVDRAPVAVGKVIAKERGIVHSTDNPIKVWGLEPGSHEFTVVVGDGTHKRIDADLEDSVTVDVKGPSVWGSAPATVDKGSDLTVELESKGIDIAGESAGGDHMSGAMSDSGHFHVLVDPATPPKAGDQLPDPKAGRVYHTDKSSVKISGLDTGEHIIWIVLGMTDHMAWDPTVMDKLTVMVT